MMRRNIIVKPGLETRDPASAVRRYADILHENGKTLEGKDILVFGYGGYLAIAVELLRAGCSHVTVCDLFPPADPHLNDPLLPEFSQYLESGTGWVIPRSKWIKAYHGDIRSIPDTERLGPFDLIVSSSVYEHLDDVDGITAALSGLLKPSGQFVAFIDLRDHYFKYPFEMLCYSNRTWKRWLNPTSNLNRYRVWDYRNILERYLKMSRSIFWRGTWKVSPKRRIGFDANSDPGMTVRMPWRISLFYVLHPWSGIWNDPPYKPSSP